VNGVSADVWIKVPSLTNNKYLTITYGNSPTLGNPNNVFEVYDTFESFNLSTWNTLQNIPEIENGYLKTTVNYQESPIIEPIQIQVDQRDTYNSLNHFLTHWWTFEDSLTDRIGNKTFVATGNVTFDTDRIAGGKSIQLEGPVTYLTQESLTIVESFTVSYWTKVYQYGGISQWNSYINDGTYTFSLYRSNGSTSMTGVPTTVNDFYNLYMNEWKHFVYTFNKPTKEAKVYLDNNLIHSSVNAAFNWQGSSNLGKLYLGRGLDFYDNYVKYDDVRIYNRVLNASEITTIYNYGYSNLVNISNLTVQNISGIETVNTMPIDAIIEFRTSLSQSNMYPSVFLRGDNANNYGIQVRFPSGNVLNSAIGGITNRPYSYSGNHDEIMSHPSTRYTVPVNNIVTNYPVYWNNIKVQILGNIVNTWYNNNLYHTYNFGTSTRFNTSGKIGFVNYPNGTLYIDNVRIYKAATNTITATIMKHLLFQNKNARIINNQNKLSFILDNNIIYEDTPFNLNNNWTHIIWNLKNNKTNCFIKLNNSTKLGYSSPQKPKYGKYPRYPATSENYTYLDGTNVRISGSSRWNTTDHSFYQSFTHNITDFGWVSAAGKYNTITGIATTDYRFEYPGEYLQIDLGEKILLVYYKIYNRRDSISRAPKTFRIYASNDDNCWTNINNINWILIDERTNISYTHNLAEFTINNTVSYRYYVIIIYTNYTDQFVQFAEWELYGAPDVFNIIISPSTNIGKIYVGDFRVITKNISSFQTDLLYDIYEKNLNTFNLLMNTNNISLTNNSINSSNAYLHYQFDSIANLNIDSSSNDRMLMYYNTSNYGTFAYENSKNCILLRNTEAFFPDDDWSKYSDISISTWFKTENFQDGDTILSCTANMFSSNYYVVLSNSGADLVNFQIKITVPYQSIFRSDFRDMRILDTDNTILNYYIENVIPSTSADIWVKVPIFSNNKILRIIAENTPSSGDPNSVFDLYDNFNTLDTTKWKLSTAWNSTGTAPIVENGYLKCSRFSNDTNVSGIESTSNVPLDSVIELKTCAIGTQTIPAVFFRGNHAYGNNYGIQIRYDTRGGAGSGLGAVVNKPYGSWDVALSNGSSTGFPRFATSSTVEPIIWYQFNDDPSTSSTLTDNNSYGTKYSMTIVNYARKWPSATVTWTLIQAYSAQLNGYTGSLSGQTYGNGTYTLTASSGDSSWALSDWFSGTSTVGPHIGGYTVGTGVYSGNFFIVSDYKGQWVKIELPSAIILTSIKLYQRMVAGGPYTGRAPLDYRLYGSNDNTNWTMILNVTGASYNASYVHTGNVTDVSTAYSKFAIVVNKLPSNTDGNLQLDEWELYGAPQYTLKTTGYTNNYLYQSAYQNYGIISTESNNLYLSYNGTSTDIQTMLNILHSNLGFSIHFIFRTPNITSVSQILYIGNTSVGHLIRVYIVNSSLIFEVGYASVSTTIAANTYYITDLLFSYVAGDKITLRIYLNNVLVGTSNSVLYNNLFLNVNTTGLVYYLGYAQSMSTTLAPVTLQDFRIYPTAINTAFISSLQTGQADIPNPQKAYEFFYSSNNLEVWYTFNSNVTEMLIDNTGKGNNLINTGGASFDNLISVTGNGSMYLNGNPQYVSFPTNIDPYIICNNGGGGITFSLWVKLSSSSGASAHIFAFVDGSGNTYSNLVRILKNGANNTVYFQIVKPSVNTNYLTTGSYFDNAWHHFVWTISSTGVWTVFIDGVNQNISVTATTIPNVSWTRRVIGYPWFSSDGWLIGNIDEFRIYNKVLLQSEILYLYSLGNPWKNIKAQILGNNIQLWYEGTSMNNYGFGTSANYNTMGKIGITTHFDGSLFVDELRVYKATANTISYTLTTDPVYTSPSIAPIQIPNTGDYYIAFTNSSITYTVTFTEDCYCQVFMIGGGGGGGWNHTGGGGAGAYYYDYFTFSKGIYTFKVGTGGTGEVGGTTVATNGGDTFIQRNSNDIIINSLSMRCKGGGRAGCYAGGSANYPGGKGVCGGGGMGWDGVSYDSRSYPGGAALNIGTVGKGNYGGASMHNYNAGQLAGGGGGGIGGIGPSASGVNPGRGGNGMVINIKGFEEVYGGGGGGGGWPGNTTLIPTPGGGATLSDGRIVIVGGTGQTTEGIAGGAGTTNTGSGGGSGKGATGGIGGTGIIIIRFEKNLFALQRLNNKLSFQINKIPIYEAPYVDNTWYYILWNIRNSTSSKGFIKINNNTKVYFVQVPVLSCISKNKLGTLINKGSLYLSNFAILTIPITNELEQQLYGVTINNTLIDNEIYTDYLRNLSALYYNGVKRLETKSYGVNVIGSLVATGNVLTYSDMRLKEVIGGLEYPLEKVEGIKTFKYVPNELGQQFCLENKLNIGVSAQDVQNVLPEIVTLAPFDTSNLDDGKIISRSGHNYLSVSYEKMVPLLIECIKELKEEIDYIKF
jgi:hypothetical protein